MIFITLIGTFDVAIDRCRAILEISTVLVTVISLKEGSAGVPPFGIPTPIPYCMLVSTTSTVAEVLEGRPDKLEGISR
ncbi:hypothetical protein GCM10027190_17000 [Spirosoma areae]